MKGIVLAGGSGTRLSPLTNVISKQLLPVGDKPMIYYPLSTLISGGIREVLIISTPQDTPNYEKLLGDGSKLGMKISYAVQREPDGIGSAFLIGRDFIGSDNVCLILGDNIFYGHDFSVILKNKLKTISKGAHIFGYRVSDPERFGVVEFDSKYQVKRLEEKPTKPKSSFAVVGLYIYDNSVIKIAEKTKPSTRGELEITDINKKYLEKNNIQVTTLDKGFCWLDTGTPESLLEASQFVSTIEKRQGIKIGCIEEEAQKNGWISKASIKKNVKKYSNSSYAKYLLSL